MIEAPKVKGVLVKEVSRLGRPSLKEIGLLSELFQYSNTLIITPERVFDLRNKYDKDAFEREMMRSNEYLEYFKEIQQNGRLASVSAGNFIGSIPPYGFDKIWITEGKKKCPTLQIKEDEANIVRMIFDMYANQNMGRTAICYRLDELGVKPSKGKQWSPTAVKEMLKNVHYIGKVRWNWRKTIKVIENSEVKKKRPQNNLEEYLTYEGRHNGIVSQEVFDAVQAKLGKNHRATTRVKIRNPFASILFCKNCGKAMILKCARKKDGTEKNLPRIMCSDQTRCGSGSCTFEELIDKVAEILKQCIEDFEVRIENNEGDSIKLHAQLIKDLEKQLKDLQAKEVKQWEMQSDPNPAKRMPEEIFHTLNAKLLKEKEEIQQALCKAYESMPEPVNYEEKVVQFQEALEALKNPEKDVELKNILLKECIERIDFFKAKPERKMSKGQCVFTMTKSNWTNPPIELQVTIK
jgi:DNA invertase Pin-like site-specific DNA recombinase